NDTAHPQIYTLSLHDALPIWVGSDLKEHATRFPVIDRFEVVAVEHWRHIQPCCCQHPPPLLLRLFGWSAPGDMMHCSDAHSPWLDRKSTRLNSSHVKISYAVF